MDRDIRLYRKELAFNRTEFLDTMYDMDEEKELEKIEEVQNELRRKMIIRKVMKKLKDIIITK